MAKYDSGKGLSAGISGAGTGLALGGPVGAAVGGLVGLASGLFGNKKKKKPAPLKKVSTLDPRQQKLYADYERSVRGKGPFSELYNWDAKGANQNFDANVSRPAYRNFQENIIPGITGQYRSNNLMNSSYSGGALSRAGRDVQENLDAQRSNMQFAGQQQSQTNRQNAMNNILGMQTFAYDRGAPQQQKGPSTLDQILSSVGPAAGDYLANYLSKGSGSTIPRSGMATPQQAFSVR